MNSDYPQRKERISFLQTNLTRNGIDIAILNYSRTVFYYVGTSQPSYLIVTPDDYHLLVARGIEHVPNESHLPMNKISSGGRDINNVIDYLKDKNLLGKNIGIEMDVTPASRYLRILTLTPGCEIVDISSLILKQRMIKDREEVEAIRSACRVQHDGHKRILNVLHEGITELELSAEIEDAHRRAGHEGQCFSRQFDSRMGRGPVASGDNLSRVAGNILSVTGVGLSSALPLGASRRQIRRGDIIVIDIATLVNGYHADQSRTYVLGRASEECKILYRSLIEIADKIIMWLRPGVLCQEIYWKAIDLSSALGVDRHFLYLGTSSQRIPLVGHGVGLEINEPPILGGKSKDVIDANVVLTVELMMYRSDHEILKIEDTILIHPDGNEILTMTLRDLHEI